MTSDKQALDIDLSDPEFLNPEAGKIAIHTGRGEIILERQKFGHRQILFRCCLGVCACLYALFAAAIARAIFSEDFFRTLLEYKHLTAFILAFLVVPSALLWGMLRAAYMSEKTAYEAEDVARLFRELHPGAGG